MSTVGIVSIAIGVIAVAARSTGLVAPAATLTALKRIFSTNARTRILGAFAFAVGAMMIWAGTSDESTLAQILRFRRYRVVRK